MFISGPHDGVIYLAERSRKSTKLLWSVMPVQPISADVRIDASEVPRLIRRRAYKLFEGDRNREERIMIHAKVYFTAKDGAEAEITGDPKALDAIEKLFEKSGIKWNDAIGTWDAGFYETKRKSQLGEP